jgi:DMSO/TMAO reductase YedYZ heme-binding membrane subunit
MQKSPNVKQSQWTPELIIQLVKEFVCAALGIFLIVYTVLMANNAFGMVGDTTRLSNAKDLLLLLISLTGVVLGYYFGRAPADARASLAMKQATVATGHAYELGNTVEGVGVKLNRMMQDMKSTTMMQNGQDVTQKMVDEMQQLSDECRNVSDKAHMLSV